MQKIYPVDIATHPFAVRCPIQMRFNDQDSFAHVNNGSQQSYFDIGRQQYVEEMYGIDFYRLPRTLILVSYTTDFISQITLDNKIEVCSSVYKIGNRSLRMIQAIFDINTHHLFTVEDSVLAAVDRTKGESFLIPDDWRERIQRMEKVLL